MIWPLAEAIYFMIGGALSLVMVPAHGRRSGLDLVPFDPGSAFVLVFGTVMLWPVLMALALSGHPK